MRCQEVEDRERASRCRRRPTHLCRFRRVRAHAKLSRWWNLEWCCLGLSASPTTIPTRVEELVFARSVIRRTHVVISRRGVFPESREFGLLPSIGNVGECCDIAVVESFLGRMQNDLRCRGGSGRDRGERGLLIVVALDLGDVSVGDHVDLIEALPVWPGVLRVGPINFQQVSDAALDLLSFPPSTRVHRRSEVV